MSEVEREKQCPECSTAGLRIFIDFIAGLAQATCHRCGWFKRRDFNAFRMEVAQ